MLTDNWEVKVMKPEIKRMLPITIAIIITSIFTLTICVISFFYHDADIWTFRSFMFRILGQAGSCITMILLGTVFLIYLKQKLVGAFLGLVSGISLFVLINTISVGLQKGMI